MKKFLWIFTSVLMLSLFGLAIYEKTQDMKSQEQGYKQSFEILNYFASQQEQKIQQISKHIKRQYRPILEDGDMETSFGIGGFEFNPSSGLSGNYNFVNTTYKRLKIDQAYARVTQNQLKQISAKANRFRDSIIHTPTIRPVAVDSIYAISSFGLRMHPILHKIMLHDGIDYAALVGTPVHATAAGRVIAARYDKIAGLYVKIDHGYHYATVYAHLSKAYVRPGQEVKKGQIIGLVGNTGRSVGPHLHYEVKVNGVPVNPVRFIAHKIEAERECLASSKRSKSIVIAR